MQAKARCGAAPSFSRGRLDMTKIWRKISGDEPQSPADRVFTRCKWENVECWVSPAGALEVAVFLEKHVVDGATSEAQANVRVAYRSFHPKPVRFTRDVSCSGGTVDEHDKTVKLTMLPGRNEGKRYRTGIVPDAVGVTRGASGAQVNAHIVFARSRTQPDVKGEETFSVVFPDDGTSKCPCC
jgi:hypothetical protein